MLRGLALLSRLGYGTLVLPERLAPWARTLGVAHCAVPDDGGASAEQLAALGEPELVLVDVFPRGVLGEITPWLARARASWLVTRRVRPGFYERAPVRSAIEAHFERIVWTEEPAGELHELVVPTTRIEPVLLAPPPLSRAAARAALDVASHEPLVLGVGSGSNEMQTRTARLLAKIAARLGASLRFASHELPPGGDCVALFPLARYLAAADVAVAAGGYHAFHELHAAHVPTVFIPQARRHDDQAWRVRDATRARDPVELERAVERALAADGARCGDDGGAMAPETADAGARALAGLVERRMQERVLGQEEIAATARA